MSLVPSSSAFNVPCAVCQQKAERCHYGVFCCDPCKMFFRRTARLKLNFECRGGGNNRCLEIRISSSSYCRACRFQKCLEVGMNLNAFNILDVKNKKDDAMTNLISILTYHDTARENSLLSKITFDDPSLKEIVEGRRTRVITRDPNYKMCIKDWCFLCSFTAANFLMNLDFVRPLSAEDKMIVVSKYFINASVLINAFRSKQARSNSQQTPDGGEFYAQSSMNFPQFSQKFVQRIRSQLVEKLIEVNITKEEVLLVILVLFCNPALPSLSAHAIDILSNQQKIYSSALFRHCQLTHQKSAPSRFTDLLSLCHVINKNHEDVEYLHMIVQMFTPFEPVCKLMMVGFEN